MRLKQTDYSIRKKQAIWDSSRDVQGLPDALRSVGAGVSTCQLFADSTTPFRGSIAKNHNSDWRIEFDSARTCDLPVADAIHFLMLRWDGNGYALESTRVPPIYSAIQPPNPTTTANGLNCWFDIHNYCMKSWDGSGWVPDRLLFVGEVMTANPGIAWIVNYSFNRRYESPWIFAPANTSTLFSHYLGVEPISAAPTVWFSVSGSDANSVLAPSAFLLGTTGFGWYNVLSTRLHFSARSLDCLAGDGTTWFTSGYFKLALDCPW